MNAKPVRYPRLLPPDDPDYRPWLGFSRPMTAADRRRALAALSRRFMRDRAARLGRAYDVPAPRVGT